MHEIEHEVQAHRDSRTSCHLFVTSVVNREDFETDLAIEG